MKARAARFELLLKISRVTGSLPIKPPLAPTPICINNSLVTTINGTDTHNNVIKNTTTINAACTTNTTNPNTFIKTPILTATTSNNYYDSIYNEILRSED